MKAHSLKDLEGNQGREAWEPCNGERRGALVAESWKMGEVTVGGDEGEDKIPPSAPTVILNRGSAPRSRGTAARAALLLGQRQPKGRSKRLAALAR